eukprot:1551295-Pleurochrysis_carterae.AAC.2
MAVFELFHAAHAVITQLQNICNASGASYAPASTYGAHATRPAFGTLGCRRVALSLGLLHARPSSMHVLFRI